MPALRLLFVQPGVDHLRQVPAGGLRRDVSHPGEFAGGQRAAVHQFDQHGNCSCGACNIEVLEGMENLPPISDDEAKVLSRIKRQGPNVRLACQAIPTGDVTIRIVPQE
jgi:uncharacterized 2Fe-2S/4Fe-4S cluster protein (DUF4445 family)